MKPPFFPRKRYPYRDTEFEDRKIVHEVSDREGEPYQHRIVIEQFGEDPIEGIPVGYREVATVTVPGNGTHVYAVCTGHFVGSGLPVDTIFRFFPLEEEGISTADIDPLVDEISIDEE